MKHTPRVDEVPGAERVEIGAIEHAALVDRPGLGLGEVATLELQRRRHALGIEVKRVDASGPEAHSRDREEPTTRSRVEEGQAGERLCVQHSTKRALGLVDTGLVEDREKALPVLTEAESLPALQLSGLLCGRAPMRVLGDRHSAARPYRRDIETACPIRLTALVRPDRRLVIAL